MKLISPFLDVLSGGYVAPLSKLIFSQDGNLGSFDGGVYYSDGKICTTGLQLKSSYRNIPNILDLTCDYNLIEGKHVFCGMLQNEHFGHFMIESLTRLWALNYLSDDFKSLVFYSRIPGLPIPKFAREFFDLLEIKCEINLVQEITKFETLLVPSPIVGDDIGAIYGHQVVRDIFSPLSLIETKGHKKIYVSRSRMNASAGGLLLESLIEKNLEAEGYVIIHPELLTIKQQLEIYNAAEHLIFSDGSALHLYAIVTKPHQNVFVIWRRKINHLFNWQIESFGGKRVKGTPCVISLYGTEEDQKRQMVGAKAVIDFEILKSQLVSERFIDGETWVVPSNECLMNELNFVASKTKKNLLKFDLC